jgi:predicted nicotinamide N-methyase
LTDHHNAMEWLSSNIELNRGIVREHAQVAPLEWGNDQHATRLEAQTTSPFDVIVGSDILYDHATHADLVETMIRFAVPANAPIYLAYPKRSDEDAFLEVAQKHFHVQVEPLDVNGSSGNHSLAILRCKE